MASDRQQWQHAYERWLGLAREGAFSVYPSVGQIAILCANYSSEGSSVDEFKNEAYTLADYHERRGEHTNIIIGPTADDIREVIQDPRIVSLYSIGDGTLSSLILGPKTKPLTPDHVYSWKDVSDATTHLKLGFAEQRQSGIMQRRLNVPLWLFAMADPRSVYAPLGTDFNPQDPFNLGDQLALFNVFDKPTVDIGDVHNLPNVSADPLRRSGFLDFLYQ
jgi:hypothetical protein